MSKSRKWKDFLLSSGIPLEYSVRNMFENLGISRPSEFSYIRKNEYGQEIIFSVDIHATKILDRNVWLEFFVECKYRHDNVKWIFSPDKYEVFFGPKFRDLFVILDQYNQNLKINSDKISEFSKNYDLCNKGVEILSTSSNPSSVKEGVYQLKYCIIHKIVDGLKHQINNLLGHEEHCFILVPILVTTAQIWRIKPGITLENIREAEKIEDICERKDILLYHEEPNDDLIRYSLEHISTTLSPEERKLLDERLKTSWHKDGFRWFISYIANNYPSMFLIINHERFESAIKNCIRFFSSKEILK